MKSYRSHEKAGVLIYSGNNDQNAFINKRFFPLSSTLDEIIKFNQRQHKHICFAYATNKPILEWFRLKGIHIYTLTLANVYMYTKFFFLLLIFENTFSLWFISVLFCLRRLKNWATGVLVSFIEPHQIQERYLKRLLFTCVHGKPFIRTNARMKREKEKKMQRIMGRNFFWYVFSLNAPRIQSYCQSKDLMLWFFSYEMPWQTVPLCSFTYLPMPSRQIQWVHFLQNVWIEWRKAKWNGEICKKSSRVIFLTDFVAFKSYSIIWIDCSNEKWFNAASNMKNTSIPNHSNWARHELQCLQRNENGTKKYYMCEHHISC